MKFISFLLVLASFSSQSAPVEGFDKFKIDVKDPQRIIAINASTTEILFQLGVGKKIIAVDVGTKYPEEVKKLVDLGHPYRPSVEGIISLKPDLVIANEENLPGASLQQLRDAKINVLILEPSHLDADIGYARRVRMISKALDKEEAGEKEIERFNKKLKAVKEKISKNPVKYKVFFLYAHGIANGFIYGRNTGSHHLIEATGSSNAADFTEGTKPLTAEAMVQISPDAIFMLKRGWDTVGGIDGVLKMPGVALTKAGKAKRILQVDDTIRWIGPRFPDFVDELYEGLHKIK